jgi:hypothetical protein
VYELLQEHEYSDISESKCSSNSEINLKISSCDEQRVSSNQEENIVDSSSMHYGIWAKSGAE